MVTAVKLKFRLKTFEIQGPVKWDQNRVLMTWQADVYVK